MIPKKHSRDLRTKTTRTDIFGEKKKKTMPGKNNIMVPNLHILKKDQNETET